MRDIKPINVRPHSAELSRELENSLNVKNSLKAQEEMLNLLQDLAKANKRESRKTTAILILTALGIVTAVVIAIIGM